MASGYHLETSAMTTVPYALPPCTSTLQPSTLQLKATPAFQLTQAKNLDVIPDFSFNRIPHLSNQQIIQVLRSKHTQNLSTFHHLSSHHLVQATIIFHPDYCKSLLNGLISTFGFVTIQAQVQQQFFKNTSQIMSLLCLKLSNGSHLKEKAKDLQWPPWP